MINTFSKALIIILMVVPIFKSHSQEIYDFEVNTIEGKKISLSTYKGKVLLIVNTASKCGFTPQYKELESLYKLKKSQGFVVLGFPCNQFGKQEPGNSEEIKTFCFSNYGVTFPLFEKIEVNGKLAHPLYKFLKSEAPGIGGTKMVKWNFTKFLVNKSGKIVNRYAPATTPKKIEKDINKLL